MTSSADAPPFRLLVLVPVDDTDAIDPFAVVAAAAAIRGASRAKVHAMLLGHAPDEEQGLNALRAGADEAQLLSHSALSIPVQAEQLLAAFSEALVTMNVSEGSDRTLVLLPAGAIGEELASRLAARMGGVALGRCAQIELTANGVSAHRPAFAGRAQVALQAVGGPLFAAMRGVKRPRRENVPAGALRKSKLDCEMPRVEASYVEAGKKMARLEGAKIVVSGGRGIGGPEGFELLDRLAESLGGVLGGSLPSVDAGWVPVARQVGQSGKFVTPEVYVAVGISGTPQHLAGIGPDSRIVAINSDADANIFKVADVGVVADWKSVVPQLVDALTRASAG